MSILDGYKTYIAAIGLVGLAIYQLSTGMVDSALQSFLAALAAFGLRQAISREIEQYDLKFRQTIEHDGAMRAFDLAPGVLPPEEAKAYRSPPNSDLTHMGIASILLLSIAGLSMAEFRVSDSPVLDKDRLELVLPESQHIRNRGGSDGLGLCVFASISHAGNYQSEEVAERMFRFMWSRPGGGYPSKVTEMFRRCAEELGKPVPPYIQHTGGDLEFLRLALQTGRYPCVTYAGRDNVFYRGRVAHMVNVVRLDDNHAVIHDNNYPGKWLWMSPSEFADRWRDMNGGWAIVLLASPPTPSVPAADLLDSPAPTELVCWRPRRTIQVIPPTYQPVPTYLPAPAMSGVPALVSPPQDPMPVPAPLMSPPAQVVPQLAPSCPDGKCPRVPGGQVIFGAGPPEFAPMDADPFPGGVQVDQIPKQTTYEIHGHKVDRQQAFEALVESALTDDRHKRFVTFVSPDAELRKKFRIDWANAPSLSKLTAKYHVNVYAPDDWHVAAAGLQPGVTIQTSVQDGQPRVLAHLDGYSGADALAESIQQIDVPPLPSNPLDWKQWAIFGVLLTLAWFRDRVKRGVGLLGRLFARREPSPTPLHPEQEERILKRILDGLARKDLPPADNPKADNRPS